MNIEKIEDTREWIEEYYGDSFRCLDLDIMTLLKCPGGFVYLSRDFSVLAKRVDSTDEYNWPELDKEYETTDAWYIHLMCGSLERASAVFRDLPKEKYFCFHRGVRIDDDKAHIVPCERILGTGFGTL